MKKIVLHIAERADGGGAESVFRDTVNSLRTYDTENNHLVACIDSKSHDFSINYKFKQQSEKGVAKLLSSIFSVTNFITLKQILKDCKPDIIHIQSYANLSPSVLFAIHWYKKQGHLKKVVNTVHTFEYICSNHAAYDYKIRKVCTDCRKSPYKFKIFYRGCSRAGYLHSIGKGLTSLIASLIIKRNVIDSWIVPSYTLKNLMLQSTYFVSKQTDISVVKNPLSKIFEKTISSQKVIRENALIYFGRLSEEKNLELLINAFALYKIQSKTDTKLFIAGEGNMYGKLKKIVEEQQLNSHVIFTGFLHQSELKKYLLRCKVSVLPSKCLETASMLVLESLFANCIPLVANQGGMQEMVHWTKFGKTFETNSMDKLAESISYLMRNYEKEIVDVEIIKRNTLPEISLQNYASKLVKLYN